MRLTIVSLLALLLLCLGTSTEAKAACIGPSPVIEPSDGALVEPSCSIELLMPDESFDPSLLVVEAEEGQTITELEVEIEEDPERLDQYQSTYACNPETCEMENMGTRRFLYRRIVLTSIDPLPEGAAVRVLDDGGESLTNFEVAPSSEEVGCPDAVLENLPTCTDPHCGDEIQCEADGGDGGDGGGGGDGGSAGCGVKPHREDGLASSWGVIFAAVVPLALRRRRR